MTPVAKKDMFSRSLVHNKECFFMRAGMLAIQTHGKFELLSLFFVSLWGLWKAFATFGPSVLSLLMWWLHLACSDCFWLLESENEVHSIRPPTITGEKIELSEVLWTLLAVQWEVPLFLQDEGNLSGYFLKLLWQFVMLICFWSLSWMIWGVAPLQVTHTCN